MLSHFSCVHSGTLWTVAHQAPLSMVFTWQEYWSVLPLPPAGDLPDPGISLPDAGTLHLLYLLHWQASSLPLAPPGKPPQVS